MSGIPPDKLQVLALLEGILTTYTPDFVLPLPDGVISFTYQLVMELVRDCLTKYQQGCISSKYLEHLQMNIRTLVQQAEAKSHSGELRFFKQLAQNVLYVLEYPTCSLEYPALERSLDPEKKPCKSDYKPLKLIGSGGFGAVHLVHHKDTNQLFAMKKQDKQKLNNPMRLRRVFQERDILAFADCPFVVSMFCSFPTKSHLCLVMEYIAGGDCGSLLNIKGRLAEPLARMYIAETVLAVEYLHNYGVVHRDLKPENLLITSTGHIKVTDFGLSKIGLMSPISNIYEALQEEITREFLDNEMPGTLYYMAPEVILRKGYGRSIDWWSLGIILHKFLFRVVPFNGNSRNEVIKSICRDFIVWKFYKILPSPNAQDMITRLLRKNPAQRLGTRGANEIKRHPFLYTIDFDNILSQKPLYIPHLVSDMDTSHFETRSRTIKHLDSSEGDSSEDIEWPESHNFISSTQRLVNLYTTNITAMNNEDPKSPPVCSPIEKGAKHSEMQKESSPGTDGDKSPSSSSTLSELPVKRSRKSVFKLRRQQKTEKVEEAESRRGSIFRRVISSCRRGLSRAARFIRGSCMFAGCRCGTRNIS